MLDISHERISDNTNALSGSANYIYCKEEAAFKNFKHAALKTDTSPAYLPQFSLSNREDASSSTAAIPGHPKSTYKRTEVSALKTTVAGQPESISNRQTASDLKGAAIEQKESIKTPELCAPIDVTTKNALLKDADLYPPISNKDGSTTYTIVQAGITDRPGRDNGVDYYSREVNITVPPGQASLNDCTYQLNSREIISKKQFDTLIERDKAASPDIDLHAHGVFTSDSSADKQALMLQLSNQRPTINLDWTAHPVDRANPAQSLQGYKTDTISAKRGNDNKQFEAAIDHTIDEIGAADTTLIGFSHGGFFDTRYLAHRVASDLPPLNTVILTHPDIPISAPELQVNGKPELLKDAANRAYVIGGVCDVEMKIATKASNLLPGTPTYENGNSEERLGDDSKLTRSLIESEGAVPISEVDRHNLSTEHFMNDAGIRQLLSMDPHASADETQIAFNKATTIGRSKGA